MFFYRTPPCMKLTVEEVVMAEEIAAAAEATAEEQKVPETSDPPLPFDPSRMVGIIKRKELIKNLAAAYHSECLQYCQELLELQTKWDEPYIDLKPLEESKKETARPSKRMKKLR